MIEVYDREERYDQWDLIQNIANSHTKISSHFYYIFTV